jgi:hypothetical protein
MKMFSVAVITVHNTVKTNVLEFRDYNFTVLFNGRPMISFGARTTDKKMLTFLNFPTVKIQALF